MLRLEFKSEEATRRLEMLREVTGDAVVGFGLEERSVDILGYHPEWLEVTRGDYQRFFQALRELVTAVAAGSPRGREDLRNAIGETWRPLLAERVGVDTGRLQEDIQTAGIIDHAPRRSMRKAKSAIEADDETMSLLGLGGGGGGRRKRKKKEEDD